MRRKVNIVVDLQNKIYNTIFLKQMDTTVIEVKILDNNIIADLNSQTVDIIFTKPDGTIVQQLASNIDKTRGIATVLLLEDCIRQSGKAKMEIEIKNTNSEVASSFYIPVQIEKTSKENVTSENTPNYFEEFANAIDDFKVNSKKMLEDIKTAENTRIENEDSRIEAENTRKSNEKSRANAEKGRLEAELERVDEEQTRAENEETRIEGENTRNLNEQNRTASENIRNTNEDTRIAAEEIRTSNEQNRKEAEDKRVEDFEKIMNELDIDAAIKDAEPTDVAAGNNIHIENALEAELVELKLEGKSEQKSRSGKNLYNHKDARIVTEGITVDDDGWITITCDNTNGTTKKYLNYFTNNLNLKTNTDYNIIAEVKNVSGTGAIHFASTGTAEKQFETGFYKLFSNVVNNKVYNSINETLATFLGNCGLRTFAVYEVGQSGSITFRLSVLEDTTITPEVFKYEAFGASPSSEFPSPIENVVGWNKLDLSKCTFVSCSLNSDGKSFTSNINNYYFCSIKTTELNEFLLNRKGKEITFSTGKEISNRFVSIVIKGVRQSGAAYQEMHSEISGSKVTIKIAEDFTSISELELRFNRSGATFSDTTTTIPFAQLVEGSEEKPYAPFNSLVVEDVGKNLAENTLEKGTSITANGITYTINDDYSITVQGTTSTTFSELRFNTNYNIKKGDYIISGGATDIMFQLIETGVYSKECYDSERQFILNEDKNNQTLRLRVDKGKTVNTTVYPMIRLASDTDSSYEPHKSQTEYFPLAEPLRGLPNEVKDTIEEGVTHRRVGTGVFQAVTQLYESGGLKYGINVLSSANKGIDTSNNNINMLCDRATCYIDVPRRENSIYLIADVSVVIFGSADDTVETFNEKFAGAEYQYELAEEVIEPFTAEQKKAWNKIKAMKLFEGVNNITVNAILNLEYMKNNKTARLIQKYAQKHGQGGATGDTLPVRFNSRIWK